MNTVTLSEQMQVIMEKVGEPAIINADFEIVDDGEEFWFVPPACACPKCSERDTDNLQIHDDGDTVTCLTRGEIYDISPAAQLDRVMLEDYGDNWSDKYALAHPGALM